MVFGFNPKIKDITGIYIILSLDENRKQFPSRKFSFLSTLFTTAILHPDMRKFWFGRFAVIIHIKINHNSQLSQSSAWKFSPQKPNVIILIRSQAYFSTHDN